MRYSWVASSILCLTVFATTASAYQIGDVVVVIRDVPLKQGNEEVDRAFPGLDLIVRAVSGDWLWVSNGKAGWIDSQSVIPLDQAVDYFTEVIRQYPQDPRAYYARAIVWDRKGERDIAAGDYNEAIRLDPSGAVYYAGRGVIWMQKGETDKAIADFNQAIALQPDALTYNNRGLAWKISKQYDRAIDDFNAAIRLAPRGSIVYANRAVVWKMKRQYDRAIADYAEAIRLDPRLPAPYNGLAWIQATCSEARYRNGSQAVENAHKACELTAWKDLNTLDTLAAAYAEAGNFDEAVRWQSKALDIGAQPVKADCGKRLELYKSGKPLRE